jgi:hypothetical protein
MTDLAKAPAGAKMSESTKLVQQIRRDAYETGDRHIIKLISMLSDDEVLRLKQLFDDGVAHTARRGEV